MSDAPPRDGRHETSSDKTLSVMDLFTPERPEWTVDEAAAALGQSGSTVYRYFRSLTAVGLIFSIRPGRYLLGPGIVRYDRQLRLSDPLLRAAEPTILDLARHVRGPGLIFISRIHRNHVMTVHEHRLDAEPFAAGTFDRGRLAPLFSGAPALSMLAFMEVRAVRAMFQKSGNEEADWLLIKRRMRAIRDLGFAIGRDDPDLGVIHVSVPVRQDSGAVVASFGIAGATAAYDDTEAERVGTMLMEASARLAERARTQAEA